MFEKEILLLSTALIFLFASGLDTEFDAIRTNYVWIDTDPGIYKKKWFAISAVQQK